MYKCFHILTVVYDYATRFKSLHMHIHCITLAAQHTLPSNTKEPAHVVLHDTVKLLDLLLYRLLDYRTSTIHLGNDITDRSCWLLW